MRHVGELGHCGDIIYYIREELCDSNPQPSPTSSRRIRSGSWEGRLSLVTPRPDLLYYVLVSQLIYSIRPTMVISLLGTSGMYGITPPTFSLSKAINIM